MQIHRQTDRGNFSDREMDVTVQEYSQIAIEKIDRHLSTRQTDQG